MEWGVARRGGQDACRTDTAYCVLRAPDPGTPVAAVKYAVRSTQWTHPFRRATAPSASSPAATNATVLGSGTVAVGPTIQSSPDSVDTE